MLVPSHSFALLTGVLPPASRLSSNSLFREFEPNFTLAKQKDPPQGQVFLFWQSTHDILGTFEDDDFEIIASAYAKFKRYW